jgi:hypothetical protein
VSAFCSCATAVAVIHGHDQHSCRGIDLRAIPSRGIC